MKDRVRLLSTHGSVLAAILRRPSARIRDIAAELGLTDRAVQGAVGDLVRGRYLERVRVGRRNHYIPQEDAQMTAWAAGVPPTGDLATQPSAVVLACSDHRHQPGLQRFLADRGLLGNAELLLWPGGGPALAGPHREALFEVLGQVLRRAKGGRLILVSHSGCQVPDVPKLAGASPTAVYRSVRRWARRIIEQCSGRLGVQPSLWFIDRWAASRVSTGLGETRRSATTEVSGQ
jgi:hypothetical protein